MQVPEIYSDHRAKTGHWCSNPNNPAEDTWHIRVDDFLGDPNDFSKRTLAFRQTRNWLEQRLWYSRQISKLVPGDLVEARLFIRPCNFGRTVFERNNFSVGWLYSWLERDSREEIQGKADRKITDIHRMFIDSEWQEFLPSGVLLTYDDDYGYLNEAAQISPEFYQRYCRDKDLLVEEPV